MTSMLVAAVMVALVVSGCGDRTSASATIAIHHSRFEPGDVNIRAGEPVAITLRNDDPIAHEWIVGTSDVHERHRTGTEPEHDTIPTEVTLRPYSSIVTTVTFDAPGDYEYICHLPGHEAYGMRGTVHVR
jgi:uncharacterized cupredoxin-like copper-binding protein